MRQSQQAEVAVEVPQPHRSRARANPLDDGQPVQLPQLLVLVGSHPGAKAFLYLSRTVQDEDNTVAGAGQRPGAVQDPLQHRLEVEALVDEQVGLDQP